MIGQDIAQAVEAIRGARQVALACHVGPDGDALGSMLAMHHLCRAAGKPSIASWPEPFVVAPHYNFVPGLDLATKPGDFPSSPEVMITFDCGSLGRLGGLQEAAKSASQLIVVDHHASNDRYGTINVIDPSAAATAVLVRELARALGWPLNRDAALCLYTGLVTDTGRFQYSNTTAETFTLAAELAAFDLPIAEITRQLFEEHRFAYLRLVAECLGRAQLDEQAGFIATWVTQDDLDRFDVTIEEAEGLIDLVRRAAEAEVSCVLKESPEGVRVSLRSISRVDVAAIASQFGGGGHKYASGFVADGTIEEVLAAIRNLVPS